MSIQNKPIIGIVGGLGPYAGLDLLRKIFDQTIAEKDQQHLSVALLSYPKSIGDRTEFILGESDVNPGYAIAEVIGDLAKLGVQVVGIPCNSAHSQAIFEVIKERSSEMNGDFCILNMIHESIKFLRTTHTHVRKVAILSTAGTYKSGAYKSALEESGFVVIQPREEEQRLVQETIYNIKAHSNPTRDSDRQAAVTLAGSLTERGADAVILGCTELPLVIKETVIKSAVVLDPAMILARALIHEVSPDSLKPL